MSNPFLQKMQIVFVINSNICGCKEAVDDQITGYLCNVKDKEDLYLKMEEFMKLSSKQRRQMGLNARNKMIREFDKQMIVKETINSIMK